MRTLSEEVVFVRGWRIRVTVTAFKGKGSTHAIIQIQNITSFPICRYYEGRQETRKSNIRFIYAHTCQPEEQVTSTAPAMSNTPAHQTIENGMNPEGIWMVEKVDAMQMIFYNPIPRRSPRQHHTQHTHHHSWNCRMVLCRRQRPTP